MDQELLDRIDLIERMMREARQSTQYWGWCFALWGAGQLVALGVSQLGWNPLLVWSVAMGACGVLTGLVAASKSKSEKSESLVSRSLMAVWVAFGISITIVAFLGNPAGIFSVRSFCVVFFTLMGFTNAASGVILRWPFQIAMGSVWWLAGVLTIFGPEKIIAWTLIAMIFLGEVVFGVYLMVRERADRRHA